MQEGELEEREGVCRKEQTATWGFEGHQQRPISNTPMKG